MDNSILRVNKDVMVYRNDGIAKKVNGARELVILLYEKNKDQSNTHSRTSSSSLGINPDLDSNISRFWENSKSKDQIKKEKDGLKKTQLDIISENNPDTMHVYVNVDTIKRKVLHIRMSVR